MGKLTANDVKKYLIAQIIDTKSDWTKISSIQKLSYLQKTPDKVVKKRKIGGGEVPYVEIDYVERALNFVSNFDRGYIITDKGLEEGKSKDGKVVYEARVQMQCYVMIDGKKIEKGSFGAWKSYANPATSKFDVYKSAESNAIKNFALTIGIGADKKWAENEAIKKFRGDNYNEEDIISGFTSNNEDE